MLLSSSDIDPASAVTSPSLTTSSGTPNSLRIRANMLRTSSKRSFGTPRKREAIIGRFWTMTPAELPPMASTRGSFDAARRIAKRIMSRW